jgi:hypothetical protein
MNMEIVHTIPLMFSKPGYHYELIYREGMTAIYKQLRNEGIPLNAFELHIVRSVRSLHPWMGNPAGTYERLAGNEEFGKYGWSFGSLTDCQAKIQELKALGRIAKDSADSQS